MERPQTDIIPFGKYKGQPVAMLQADAAYCEWLLAQAWFVQRYPTIHTVVINQFGEPSETPEHNRLQLRFLDPVFRARATAYVLREYPVCTFLHAFAGWCPTRVRFEVEGQDVFWRLTCWCLSTPGAYVELPYYDLEGIGVECKPTLGDEYPAVLRFLKNLPLRQRNKGEREYAWLLVIGDYQATGGTLEEVRTFFRLSNILLATVEEIEGTPPLVILPQPPPAPPDPT